MASSFALGHVPSGLSVPSLLNSSSFETIDTEAASSFLAAEQRKILYPMPCDTNRPWTGLTPLEMIQKIMSMTEAHSSSSESDVQLQPGRSWLQAFLGGESHPIDQHDDRAAEALIAPTQGTTLARDEVNEWRPSDTVGDSPQVAILDTLASNFELESAGKEQCLPSYHRVQQAFLEKVVNGVPHSVVIGDATAQMVTLIEMIREEPKPGPRASSRPSFGLEVSPFPLDTFSPEGVPSDEAFGFYMSHWLASNWIHPFPDDLMLQQLAEFLVKQGCITLTEKEGESLQGLGKAEYREAMVKIAEAKVTNFLVNNRTRRWRKSIATAFDMKRPATLLVEDSLRIYEDKELRSLDHWNGDSYFAFDGKYSVSLSEWKKQGLLGNKAKNAKSRKRSFASMEASAPPPVLNQMSEAPFDLSPCFAFERAGGAQMLLDANALLSFPHGENASVMDDSVGGSFAAI